MLVFTDGSVKMQGHQWLTHGGWGIFVAQGALANDYGPLEKGPFSSYRAELRGLMEAVSRAATPVCIVIDNEAVCEGARRIIDDLNALQGEGRNNYTISGQMDPMWGDIVKVMKRAPKEFYRVLWQPSHLEDEGNEQRLADFLEAGGDINLVRGNAGADKLAEAGAALQAPPLSVLQKDRMVLLLAKKVQTMQVLIWAAFKGYIPADYEFEMLKLAQVVDDLPSEEDPWLEADDPGLQMFLEQCDTEGAVDLYEDFDTGGFGAEYDFGGFFDEMAAAFPDDDAEPEVELCKAVDPSIIAKASRIRASIMKTAPFFPYCLDYVDPEVHRITFAPQHSLIGLLNEVRLNKVSWKLANNATTDCKAQLLWLEPFAWALQQLRWTKEPGPSDTSIMARSLTCSWMELGIIVFVLSRGQAMPNSVTFAACAAITRNLWVAASKYLRLKQDNGNIRLFKCSIKELPRAGATVTCGIKSPQGLSRRPIMDDFPSLSFITATCLKLASESGDKLDTKIPLLTFSGPRWQASGLLNTVVQVRAMHELKVDSKPLAPKRKRARQSPCMFRCQPKATLSQNGSIQW